jgi:hypothetical protein
MSNKRELAERLELAKQFAPKGPLSDEEIIASVHAHLPNHHPFLPGQLLATLTSLTTTVDGVASLGFYTVYIYEPGLYGYNYVVIGSPYPDAWQTTPTAQIYLANALFPARTDIVITCRIMGQPGGWPPVPLSITGSNLSPPVSQSFNVPGGAQTISFVVPAGTSVAHPGYDILFGLSIEQASLGSPGDWCFYDCTITRILPRKG